ncbi:unnamed protein product [Notodromas monacha]|uniref:Uncharacterized protein n=1 Tax=Notodromas monacha TaxID=399045 RepID=A0A7R9BKL8_9CRUS|nr:unnamed protein product [Notodromas monacha]CAG0915896.1 unnamed protein product [Notodromas monacha]
MRSAEIPEYLRASLVGGVFDRRSSEGDEKTAEVCEMPSLTTSSPGPGPEELRYGDVALSASSAASSAQVSPNAAAKQNAAEPESEQRHDDCASDAESERRDESTGLGGGGGGDGSVAETAPMPPTSVGVMPTMMPGTVMYPEWGDEYLVNGGYSVSPTAYMSMGYANGAAQRRQTPTSNIAPGSPSPGGGLLSPSKAVAYNPWPAMQQQSTWSPPGGPHLGLPIWNQAHLQQQQRGRAMPSMSPSSPMTQNSYALAAAARGKYSTPPGIPASTAGMAPYAAAAAAVVQNSTKWPSYQTEHAEASQSGSGRGCKWVSIAGAVVRRKNRSVGVISRKMWALFAEMELRSKWCSSDAVAHSTGLSWEAFGPEGGGEATTKKKKRKKAAAVAGFRRRPRRFLFMPSLGYSLREFPPPPPPFLGGVAGSIRLGLMDAAGGRRELWLPDSSYFTNKLMYPTLHNIQYRTDYTTLPTIVQPHLGNETRDQGDEKVMLKKLPVVNDVENGMKSVRLRFVTNVESCTDVHGILFLETTKNIRIKSVCYSPWTGLERGTKSVVLEKKARYSTIPSPPTWTWVDTQEGGLSTAAKSVVRPIKMKEKKRKGWNPPDWETMPSISQPALELLP